MHDSISIRRNGTTCVGARYLRTADGGVSQSIFYRGRRRADPVGYARFASDDPAMSAVAERLLAELVDEAVAPGHLS
jgi:hypothetical protein